MEGLDDCGTSENPGKDTTAWIDREQGSHECCEQEGDDWSVRRSHPAAATNECHRGGDAHEKLRDIAAAIRLMGKIPEIVCDEAAEKLHCEHG